MELKLKTPKVLSESDFEFMKSINNNRHIFLKISNESKRYTPLECFDNVKQKIKQDGGSPLFGWCIWKNEVLIEAEFHCVWQSRNKKQIIDITPQMDGGSRIIFLPEYEIEYKGHLINNIRRPLIDNPMVLEYIDHFDTLYNFRSELHKKYKDQGKPNNEEIKMFRELSSKTNFLSKELEKL